MKRDFSFLNAAKYKNMYVAMEGDLKKGEFATSNRFFGEGGKKGEEKSSKEMKK